MILSDPVSPLPPAAPQEDQCVQTDPPQPDLPQPQEVVVVVQDLASLRKRQRDVSQQCELLEHRYLTLPYLLHVSLNDLLKYIVLFIHVLAAAIL